MPLISAITTCKGRLQHLKVTLPALMALPDCEVIVVDYDCPDGAGAWVRDTYPAAKLVRVADQPVFNISKARNLGIAAAVAPWLLFIDADALAAPSLVDSARPLLEPGVYLQPSIPIGDAVGTLIAARADLEAIGGYDEVFEGYGSEDLDVVVRLVALGRRLVVLPRGQVGYIRHDDSLRGRFHAIADKGLNTLINATYRHAKADLTALGVTLDEAARTRLYAQIREACLSPEGLTNLEVAFDEREIAYHRVTKSLRYRLRPPDWAAGDT